MKAVYGDWPVYGLKSDVRPALSDLLAQGRPSVLATLGHADGGAPFGLGAQMLFAEDTVTGFISGGCVEADVALHAGRTLEDGQPRRLVYGEGGPPDIRLPCGGRLVLLVERIGADDDAARQLVALNRARRRALWLSDGRRRFCQSADEPLPRAFRALGAPARARAALAGFRLMRRFDPRQRLVVVGSDPIALAIAEIGPRLGWETTLLRPHGPQAGPPFAEVAYRRGESRSELEALAPDPWTAVVIAIHGGEEDHAALRAAVVSGAGYVGVLGSRKRLPARLARLQADGVPAAGLQRVHAPVGLAIGARSPFEIAVSVTGQIVQAIRAQEAAAPSAVEAAA